MSEKLTSEPDQDAVWRVCEVIRGDCEHCPPEEDFGEHGVYKRGCYLQATECVNVVETGNPWRKTTDVRSPWVVLALNLSGGGEG